MHLGRRAAIIFFLLWGCRSLAAAGQIIDECNNNNLLGLSPAFVTEMQGFFSTGAALVDINGDSLPDLVLSNGNDMSPQPLTVFYNRNDKHVPFARWPDWYSEEIEYMGDLAVGDVDGNGWLDVAVAVAMDHRRRAGTGGVRVFFNRDGQLEPRASYRTAGSYETAGCTLGDVDVDGDLDLVVPVIQEGLGGFWAYDGPFHRVEGPRQKPGQGLIYLNRYGALDASPSWISEEGIVAGDAQVADVNQDGWMDVAFAGLRTQVYFGHDPGLPREHPVPIPRQPGWVSAEEHRFSYSVDSGFRGKVDEAPVTQVPRNDGGLLLAVSSGCSLDPPCNSRFLLYRPVQSDEAFWSSVQAQNASKLVLADLNSDGYLDLATDQWGEQAQGGPLWIFLGSEKGFNSKPDIRNLVCRVGEAFAVADPFLGKLETASQTFAASARAGVVTLPRRWLHSVLEVKRSGRVLASNEWAWSPESNWISLARPLEPGETLEVIYRYPTQPSLAMAVWQPQFGSMIFSSF